VISAKANPGLLRCPDTVAFLNFMGHMIYDDIFMKTLSVFREICVKLLTNILSRNVEGSLKIPVDPEADNLRNLISSFLSKYISMVKTFMKIRLVAFKCSC